MFGFKWRLLGPDDDGGGSGGGEALDTSGGADAVGNDNGYEPESMEAGMLETLREIQARDEGGEGEEAQGDGKTIRVKEHVRKVKGDGTAPNKDAAAEIDPITGKPKVSADAPAEPTHKVLPRAWKRELAADFAKLPENVQQEIHRREADAFKGVQMYKRDADFAKELADDFIVPYQADFKAVGQAPKAVVKQVMGTWSSLVRAAHGGDKASIVGTFSQMLQDFGITASDLSDPRDGGQNRGSPGDSPRVAALERELNDLRGALTSQEQQRQQAEIATMAHEYAKFRSDPANEFVDTLQSIMQRLILAGEAANYREAYDKAALLDASVRAKLDERKAAELRNRETAQAAAARKAAGIRMPNRGTPPPAAKPGSVDDTLRSAYREIQARGA